MSYKKIGIANLMPGGEDWWHEQNTINHPQRYGITEQEMEADKAGPNGEVVRLADQKNWPPQSGDTENPAAANTGRKQVDEGNVNDPQQVEQNKELIQGSNDNATPATTSSPSDKPTDHAQAVHQSAPGVGGYDDILALMKANTLSEGDMARRQHSREIVTGLGDLVSSIANMWATTKGAPNAYDNAKGMTATSQSLYDRELARRKAQNENILNYYRVKKAAEDDERVRKYREDIAEREQRRLDEAKRHNKEMENISREKAEADKENKERAATEKERSNKANEEERNRHNQAVENKKTQGSAGGNKSGNKSNKSTSKKKKKQSSLYGSKKKLY